ncbi:MAG: glycogen synthase [Gammaproteobacteria bacterium]
MTAKKSLAAKNKKILFVTSEAHPLIKTGGLGDVSGALPGALKEYKQDVRLILPAYRDAMRHSGPYTIASLVFQPAIHPIRLLEGRLPDSNIIVWLVDIPSLFDRPGNPYLGPDGRDWPDNALRYGMFARAVTAIALNQAGLDWHPDIVHCNDWQTGLIPPLLSLHSPRPATVFTVHNLAYQGIFPASQYQELGLPAELWGMHGLEFYDQLSFIKGGLLYADMISTVSPGKAADKAAQQKELGLRHEPEVPLLGFVGRLVPQKGIDLILGVLGNLLDQEVQCVFLGSGDKDSEKALTELAAHYPHRCHVRIGFSEQLAHHIEAASDMFLMPSRYEPCGLNQIYSMRYGTLPIVRRTGGLADTVVDAAAGLDNATGFVFDEPTATALAAAVQRALDLYRTNPRGWLQLMHNAMNRDYSWRQSAGAYLDLYQQALIHCGQTNPTKAI